MTDFLAQAACRGMKPRQIDARSFHSRQDLMSRLLKERQVARFVVAPDGFGKSTLACEYAETIFSFNHVFWVDGRSPCFLRDLDRGNLSADLLARDSAASLVVFEDVPFLDEDRAEMLSRAIDALLAVPCEVLITSTASHDALGHLQRDRRVLGAQDMLLSDSELEAVDAWPDQLSFASRELPGCAHRIPTLAWGGEGALQGFLKGLVRDDLPGDVLAWIFVALAMGDGEVGATPLLPPLPEGILEAIAHDHPYVGLSEDLGEFFAVGAGTRELVASFSPVLSDIARTLGAESVDGLSFAIADELMAAGKPDRACNLVRYAASRAARGEWLASRGRTLLRRGALISSCELYETVALKRSAEESELSLMQAWRLGILGDAERACKAARRVIASPYSSEAIRAYAAILVGTWGDEADARKSIATLRTLLGYADEEPLDVGAMIRRLGPSAHADDLMWHALASLRVIAEAGGSAGSNGVEAAWSAWRDAGSPDDALLVAGAWILRKQGAHAPDSVIRHLHRVLSLRLAEDEPFDLFASVAGKAYQDAFESAYGEHALEGECVRTLAGFLAIRSQQMKRYRHASRESGSRYPKGEAASARGEGSLFETASGLRESIPTLNVKLFGGMDVSLGGRPLEDGDFRRTKAKTMLALLVLAEGKEVPRNDLVESLWPSSSITHARRNLYSVWSQLRRALSLPDGSCPYVIRRQGGYKIDTRFVRSDVGRANELCRGFALRQRSPQAYRELLNDFYEIFGGDLLPGEVENEEIVRLRDDYRKRVVDSLLGITHFLGGERRAEEALGFANCAFDMDRNREDVYIALMRAQRSMGQRIAALETYYSLRRFLGDELGVEPSAEAQVLYREILEDGQGDEAASGSQA